MVLIFIAVSESSAQFWSEDFGVSACGEIDTADNATTLNGNWSVTYPTTNAVDTINRWFISSRESFMGVGNCGDGCAGGGNTNRTLHVSTNELANVDPGAVFNNDSLADMIVWSDAIPLSTFNADNILLEFDYIEGGSAADNGTVVVGIGGTGAPTLLADPPKTIGACGNDGEWSHYEVFLDTNYNSQIQFYIGFRFVSNGDGVGNQPSFAIDNITLSDTIPDPNFVMSADSICEGETVNFTNLTSSLNASYFWEFGSAATPTTSLQRDPQNISFTTPGTYVITLTATNTNGIDSVFDTLEVLSCQPPVPGFVASSVNICQGQCIDFFDNSIPGSFGTGQWNWQFQGGNPNVSTQQNPSNICYTTSGTYDITMTVTDVATGLDSTVIFPDAITVSGCAVPTVAITSDTTEICNNDFITFYAITTGDPDSITWEFEGGNPAIITSDTDSIQTIQVFYPTPGIYNVSIRVWNSAGEATDTIIDYITVLNCPPPIARFESSPRVICPEGLISFQDNSQYATEWYWEFPGGLPSSSTDQNPVDIQYFTPGTYPVTLIVTNVNGEDTLIEETYVRVDSCLPPEPRYEFERDSICRSTCVQFFNQSLRTDSFFVIFYWLPYPDSITGTSADTITAATPGYEWMAEDTFLYNDTFVIWRDPFPVMPRFTNEEDRIFCFDDSGSIGVQFFAYNQYGVSAINDRFESVLNVGGAYPELKVGPDITLLTDNIESRFYLDDTTKFEVTGTGPYFQWYPQEGLSCYDCPTPIVYPTETRKYFVANYDDYGCQANDSIIVYVEESYYAGIPNIFSPNGDDNNDILWVRGNGISSEGFTMRVWNRYGEMVFESFTQNEGWDGNYKGGPAAAGSYKFHVKVTFENGKTDELTGNVTLVRY